jgi:hypothetical protein
VFQRTPTFIKWLECAIVVWVDHLANGWRWARFDSGDLRFQFAIVVLLHFLLHFEPIKVYSFMELDHRSLLVLVKRNQLRTDGLQQNDLVLEML